MLKYIQNVYYFVYVNYIVYINEYCIYLHDHHRYQRSGFHHSFDFQVTLMQLDRTAGGPSGCWKGRAGSAEMGAWQEEDVVGPAWPCRGRLSEAEHPWGPYSLTYFQPAALTQAETNEILEVLRHVYRFWLSNNKLFSIRLYFILIKTFY